MSGHVFVVRGDVTNMVCDWWVLPSGRRGGVYGEVRDRWLELAPYLAQHTSDGFLHQPPDRNRRAVVIRPPATGTPGVIAVNSGSEGDDAHWFGKAIDAVAELVLAHPAITHAPRPYPTVAFPPIGTGAGGGKHISAGVLASLLERAQAGAARDIDFVLVTRDGAAYSAAQRLRTSDPFDCGQEAHVQHLADEVRRGRVVPFVGAGVSQAAGLDSWGDLLAKLAKTAHITDPSDLSRLGKMDARDAAQLIDRRLRPKSSVSAQIRKRYRKYDRPSLTHQLLASLPITRAITTNYDRLFETAWSKAADLDSENAVLVFPRNLDARGDRWLLKLHGDIDDPKRELVLARDSYARLQQAGTALTGILQAMLMTSHLLIVGYGLTDETFHRVAHDIRAVRPAHVGPDAPAPIATALVLGKQRLEHELWTDDFDIAPFGDTADGSDDAYAAAARDQQIFLDRLCHLTAPVGEFILDPRMGELSQTEPASVLHDALCSIQRAFSSGSADPLLLREVEQLLARFGSPRQAAELSSQAPL